ncbi:MAG: hypothetical protein ACXW30_04050 [Micavibrio sp.]
MAPHIKEYYLRGDQPILLVMTLQRRALQAWTPGLETGKMERHDTLIMDVLHSEARPISRDEFETLCNLRKVDPAVPEKGIQLSFKLAKLSPDQKANTIPAPQQRPARHDNHAAPAP